MKVRGILVDGEDGQTYLLGIGPRSGGSQAERPSIWRVSGANYESLEESRSAAPTIRDCLGIKEDLAPPQNHDSHVKHATLEALTEFIKKFFYRVRW